MAPSAHPPQSTIAQAFQQYRVWQPAGMPAQFSQQLSAHRLEIDLVSHERLASEMQRVVLMGPAKNNWSAPELQAWATAVAAEISYLSEPLQPWELDVDAAVATVRSWPPQAQGAVREFFHLLAQADRLLVQRLRSQPGGGHQGVPFVLTHDITERLVGDLIDLWK